MITRYKLFALLLMGTLSGCGAESCTYADGWWMPTPGVYAVKYAEYPPLEDGRVWIDPEHVVIEYEVDGVPVVVTYAVVGHSS